MAGDSTEAQRLEAGGWRLEVVMMTAAFYE
jgi:hypothetical protein